jgi:putative FmdB family regulatory protein
MPIYEYECKSCGTVQELMQKTTDPTPEACDKCQRGPMVKLISRTAFVLKGEGWYVTDFRDKGKKSGGSSGGSSGSGSSSGSSGTGDSGSSASSESTTTTKTETAGGCGAGACGAGHCAT